MGDVMILRYIHYFLAVAEHGSFTRAAAALYVSQPALSQQIRLLEQTLEVQLFDRSGRHIRLTDAGKAFQQHARQAMRELEAGARAVHDVADLRRGHLRLGITPTYTPWLMGPLLSAFWQRYPGVTLSVSEAPQGQIEQQLLNDQLDIGLGFAGDHAVELAATPLMQELLVMVVGAEHPLARQKQIALTALAGEPLVLLDRSFTTRVEIDRQCHTLGVNPTLAMETNTLGAILALVPQARLASILPDTLARTHGGLCTLDLSPPLYERTGVALTRKNSRHAAASALLALLNEVLTALNVRLADTA